MIQMLMFPKPDAKKQKRKLNRAVKNRREKMYFDVHRLDRDRCRAFWIVDSDNPMENVLECCHIIPRDKNRPELDEPWNVILLRKFVHEMFDGKRLNGLGRTARQYKIYVLEEIKKVHPEEFRWQLALDVLKSKEEVMV